MWQKFNVLNYLFCCFPPCFLSTQTRNTSILFRENFKIAPDLSHKSHIGTWPFKIIKKTPDLFKNPSISHPPLTSHPKLTEMLKMGQHSFVLTFFTPTILCLHFAQLLFFLRRHFSHLPMTILCSGRFQRP